MRFIELYSVSSLVLKWNGLAVAERGNAGVLTMRLLHDDDRARSVLRREAGDDAGALFIGRGAKPLQMTVLLFEKKCVHNTARRKARSATAV